MCDYIKRKTIHFQFTGLCWRNISYIEITKNHLCFKEGQHTIVITIDDTLFFNIFLSIDMYKNFNTHFNLGLF